MRTEIKYENQTFGEPIAGERMSTNGHYTGEHMGTPMQDAKNADANVPHYVESVTVRYGTMTQDAIAGSTPKVAKG